MINENLKNKRLKERFTMRNGMSGQIIEYRKATDCDFRFDDGTVIKHLTYYQIANKSVKNPNIQNVKITKKTERNCWKRKYDEVRFKLPCHLLPKQFRYGCAF